MDHTAVAVNSYFRGRLIDARLVGRGRRRGCFRIGSSKRAHAPAAEALIGGAEHALVTVDDGAAALHLTPAMTGPPRLPEDGDAEVRCGAMTFRIGWAELPAIAVVPAPPRWHWPTQRYTLGVALATLVAAFMLALVPPDRKALSLDMDTDLHRYAVFRINAPAIAAPARKTIDAGGRSDQRAAGRPDAPRSARSPRLAVRGNSQRRQPGESPSPVTAVDLLGRSQTAAVRAVFTRAPALGEDADTVLADVTGDASAAMPWGLGGLYAGGTGDHDAGTGEPMIKHGGGPWSTIDGRDPFTRGPGAPGLDGRLQPKTLTSIPQIEHGQPNTTGALDKEIVRRIIRAHLNQIRFCYEAELLRRPTLAGRVVLQFAIAPNGQVLSSVVQDSTLHLAPLESCMTQAVRRWTFPQPARAGLTIVTYPFVLTPAGG